MTVLVENVDLFTGSRFSSNGIAGNRGIFCRSVRYHRANQLAHDLGCFRGNGLTPYCRFLLQHRITLGIHHFGYNVRFHQISSVYNGGNGGNQLQRGQFKGLTEGSGGQGCCTPFIRIGHQFLAEKDALALSRQVDAGLFGNAKFLNILIKPLSAQLQRNMGKGDIAGILQSLGCLFRAMTGRTPAMQQLRPPGDLFRAGTMKRGIQVDSSTIQSCRHGQYLKGRTGFIPVGDHPITPLLQLRLIQGLLISLQAILIGCTILWIGSVILPQLFQFLLHYRVQDLQILIGVVAPQGGHSQDLPGLDIHDHPKCAVLHLVAIDSILHLLFQASLNCSIQCQYQAAAWLGSDILFIGIGHIHFIIALCGDHFAGNTLKIAIIGRLDPLRAGIGGIGKSDHLGSQRSIRIIALGIGLQMDTGDPIFIHIRPDHSSGLLRNAGSDLLIPHGGILRLL